MNRKFILRTCRRMAMALVMIGTLPVRPTWAEPTLSQPSPDANRKALEPLVADILEHNPELNFYRAQIAAAKAQRKSAAAWTNPELSATVGTKRVTDVSPSGEGIAWSVSLLQTFEWPGRIPLRKAIANRQMQLAELGLAQFKATLAARARTLAFGLFAAEEKSAAANEVAGRLHAVREVLVQRDPAGLTPILELRIIEATELALERKSAAASLAEKSASLELNQLSGKPLLETMRVEAGQLTFTNAPALDVLVKAAQTNNFEIQARQAELEQQGFRVDLAKNERYPAISVGPYYSLERGADREQQVGLGISLPLPLWNRNSGNINTEEARQEQAAASLALVERNIERQVVETALAYQTKLTEMAKWREDSAQQFREAAELADRHYRLGAVPISIYVELQKQYLEAIETLLDTRLEALEAGEQLQSLTGLEFNPVHYVSRDKIEPSQKTPQP